jgi:Type IV secretion-system coupling protein DNA-binding domain
MFDLFNFDSVGLNRSLSGIFDFINLLFLILVAIIFIVLVGAIIGVFVRRRLLYQNKFKKLSKLVFLDVQIPEQSYERVQKEGRKDEKETISQGEQLFRTLNNYTTKKWKAFFFGRDAFSFEIVNKNGKINFWIAAPEKTVSALEKQIIAAYPRCMINRVKEPATIPEGSYTYAEEYTTDKIQYLPFRTYRNMESDPVNVLTNAMTGVNKDDTLIFQVILAPIKPKWQSAARKLALKIQQGQNPDDVLYPKKDFFKGFFKILKLLLTPPNQKKDESQSEERKIDYSGKKTAIQLTPQQTEIVKKLEEKSSHPGYLCNIRVVASSMTEGEAEKIIQSFQPALQIFDIRPFNNLTKVKNNSKKVIENYLLRSLENSTAKIINTEEVNSLWHLPNYMFNNPTINFLTSFKPPLPINLPRQTEGSTFIGDAKSGNEVREVHMSKEDRFRHAYVLGGSGSGKTVLMLNMILADIENGNGLCVVDPHGELIDDILLRIPDHRLDDIIIFSPSQTEKPLGLNMLEFDQRKPAQRTLVIDTIFQIWDKLYDLKSTGGPMFEQYMKNSMKLVMSHPESGNTLLEINKVLADEEYRNFKLAMCKEQSVIDFWEKEATKAGGDASLENMVPYITSKLAAFVQNDFIKPMIGQSKSSINFRTSMDNKKIVLVKLEKGLIGEISGYLLGMVIIGQILLAGMGRNDGLRYNEDGTVTEVMASERPPFFVYIDEMQNFLFDAIPKALEEIRKYKVGFCLAHQFVKQVIVKGDDRIKDSIMANTGSKFIYRCSPDDAEYLAKEFEPTLSPQDLMNPERFTCNARILINGEKSKPFNLAPRPEPSLISKDRRKLLLQINQEKYGRDLASINKDIEDRQTKFLF